MKSQRIKNLAKIIGGILVAFALAEAAVRLLGFPSVNTNTFDKDNLTIFKPNQTFLVKDRCYASTLKTNDQGFHALSYPTEKPAGTFRIAILGDSFVEAVQVPIEKTFPYLLEKKLNENAKGIRYEVIPIAKSGHGTLMNLLYAREYALKFNPDLIIDAFDAADLQYDLVDDATLHAVSLGGAYDPNSFYLSPPATGSRAMLFFKHFILEKSLLFERLWMNLTVARSQFGAKQPAAAASASQKIDPFMEAQVVPEGGVAKAMWDKEERALKTFSLFAKSHSVKFLLLDLAEGYDVDPTELVSRFDLSPEQAASFDFHAVQKNLSSIASKAGFSFLSTRDFFLDAYKNSGNLPVWSCDNHYNEVGQQWTADALFQFLTDPSNRLLPTKI